MCDLYLYYIVLYTGFGMPRRGIACGARLQRDRWIRSGYIFEGLVKEDKRKSLCSISTPLTTLIRLAILSLIRLSKFVFVSVSSSIPLRSSISHTSRKLLNTNNKIIPKVHYFPYPLPTIIPSLRQPFTAFLLSPYPDI